MKLWQEFLNREMQKPYAIELTNFLDRENTLQKTIYPAPDKIFEAFKLTPWNKVKVVILGQDPYVNVGQAHGLAFSVPSNVTIPPALRNVFKEANVKAPHGDLSGWAKQGVLLLNTVLTVEQGKPNSHKNRGWEVFTDAVIKLLNDEKSNLVFILWGDQAKSKAILIDDIIHCVLTSSHPSPLSAYRGFFGCDHFEQANNYLTFTHQTSIDWTL